MTTTQTGSRTAVQIATEALGENLDALNWVTYEDGCQPWHFDDAVFVAADHVRRTLTSEEEERMTDYVSDSELYYNTLEALRGRPGGRNFVTARLIVAMYWRMEVTGLDDDPGPYPDGEEDFDNEVTDAASLAEIEHGCRHEMY
jgi:hypothetical protein